MNGNIKKAGQVRKALDQLGQLEGEFVSLVSSLSTMKAKATSVQSLIAGNPFIPNVAGLEADVAELLAKITAAETALV